MRRVAIFVALLAGVGILVLGAATTQVAADSGRSRHIALVDDCDPTDLAWGAIGGCVIDKGSVTRAEFGLLLASPLSPTAVVGHPSWRFDPGYLLIESGKRLRVTNYGGRAHTFTEVAQFGGGNIPNPALNKGLTIAPACTTSISLPAGAEDEITGLSAGNHRFQCCFHPWMRAVVKVEP